MLWIALSKAYCEIDLFYLRLFNIKFPKNLQFKFPSLNIFNNCFLLETGVMWSHLPAELKSVISKRGYGSYVVPNVLAPPPRHCWGLRYPLAPFSILLTRWSMLLHMVTRHTRYPFSSSSTTLLCLCFFLRHPWHSPHFNPSQVSWSAPFCNCISLGILENIYFSYI